MPISLLIHLASFYANLEDTRTMHRHPRCWWNEEALSHASRSGPLPLEGCRA